MKYMLLSLAALAAVFGLCFLVAGLIRRRLRRKPPLFLHVIICVSAGMAVLAVSGAVFLQIHYAAQPEAVTAFAGSGVTVRQLDGGYLADGAGGDTVLVFYPGAKVDAEAYLPPARRLAEKGIDCFVVNPPFRLSLLDTDAADRLLRQQHYAHVWVGGHSMGGVSACSYAAAHTAAVDGVVLLAAYPAVKLDDSLPLLLVYGSEDRVFDKQAYQNVASLFPKGFKEVTLQGGNHANFGCYGKQAGDGEAAISQNKQQSRTVDEIAQFMHAK